MQGTLKDGTDIAVKMIGSGSAVTPEKQFQNEVGNLMAVRHENIVKLVGFCYETKKKVVEHKGKYILTDAVESLLCYEYMKMGSLEKHIFGMILFYLTYYLFLTLVGAWGPQVGVHFLYVDAPLLVH
jgi:hypothetical protein